MSQKPRTIPELSQEYTQVCTKAGHIQFQIRQLEKDLAMVNQSLVDLNLEAAQAQQAQAAEQAAKAAEAAQEPVLAVTPTEVPAST